jgi:hypothetical protein
MTNEFELEYISSMERFCLLTNTYYENEEVVPIRISEKGLELYMCRTRTVKAYRPWGWRPDEAPEIKQYKIGDIDRLLSSINPEIDYLGTQDQIHDIYRQWKSLYRAEQQSRKIQEELLSFPIQAFSSPNEIGIWLKTPIYYFVKFERNADNMTISCTCASGSQGDFCKHSQALLSGDFSKVVQGKGFQKDIETLLLGTDVQLAHNAYLKAATKATKKALKEAIND